MTVPVHPQEDERLAVLHGLGVLDTPAEAAFDALVACAARLSGVPIALLSLVDDERQWFKARHGLDLAEVPRAHAFCAHTILGDALLEVADTQRDARFHDNPFVAGEPYVRFYAGQPLRVDGQSVGTLCLVDVVPRTLADEERVLLGQLAAAASELLQSRRRLRDAARQRVRLLDFARAAGDWMWETDADHRLVWASQAFESITGAPVSTRMGESIAGLRLLDEHGQPFADQRCFGTVLDRHAPFVRVQVELRTVLGRLLPVSRSAVPILDARGHFAGYRGTGRDMTAVLAATADSRRAAAELRELAAQVPGVLFSFRQGADGQAAYPFVSDGALSVFGLPTAALQDDPSAFFRHVQAEDLPGLQERIGAGARLLQPIEHRYRIRRPDGALRWVETHAAPSREADGSLLWHGFTADITERQATEAALREHEERWRLAAGAAGIGIAQYTVADARVRLDRLACANHGLPWPQDGFKLADWVAQIDPADRAAAGAGVQQALTSGAPFEGRYRIHRPGGGVRWLEFVVRATLGADGRPDGVIGTCRDVHEQQMAAELQLQKRQAERDSQAKSELLSRVSHELRTPLNAILGFTQLMALDADQPLSSGQAQRLDSVAHAGRHLLALIDDVLDLSRIGQGEGVLASGPVDVDAALRGSLAMLQPLADQAGVRLDLPAARGVWVRGDARALEQVLMNLLSNAIKFSPRGEAVTVELAMQDGGLSLAVRDRGLGMSQAQQARLFQPFDRLGVERQRIPGSGLGLVIARQLVVAMGGRIAVDSAPGVGSTFSLHLSRAAAPAAPEPPPAAPAAAPPVPAVAREPRHVIYIEDEPLNQVLLAEVFRGLAPWLLTVAPDGASGLARVREARPDLLLIDMNLPDTDGLALIRQVRAEPAWQGLRCIALSADALPEQVAAARAAGFDDYWTKPIDLPQVLARLARLLA